MQTTKFKYKSSYHLNFQILSKVDICHQCIIRWFPRNDELDKYVNNLPKFSLEVIPYSKDTNDNLDITEVLKESNFVIIDNYGSIFYSPWDVLIHPECNEQHSKSKINFFSELEQYGDCNLLHYVYQTEKDIFNKYHFVSIHNTPSIIKGQNSIAGWGVHENLHTARIKSVMESFERFHILMPAKTSKIVSSFEELDGKTCDMHNAFLFDSKQYLNSKFKPFSSKEHFTWVKGENLTFPKQCYIPLEYTELRRNLKRNRRYLLNIDSTGAAAHFTEDKCIEKGFLEVMERASQYIFWVYNECQKINVKSLNGATARMVNIIKQNNIDVHLFFNSIIPNLYTFICCLGFKGKHVVFGSSCDFNIENGILKAIEEAYGQYSYGNQLLSENKIQDNTNVNDYDEPIDHLKFYLDSNNISYLSNYFDLKEVTLPKIDESDLKKCLVIAKELNWDVFIINRGSNLTENLGIEIYQTIIPQLPSLGFNLRELRVRPNKQTKELSFLKYIPHPFS